MPTNTRSQWRTVEGQIYKRNEIHPQIQSPLFGKCSPEIRNSIYRWALIAEEDPSKTLASNNHEPRPGDSCGMRPATALLLTCSAVYLETHRLVVNINEHVFWHQCSPPCLEVAGALKYPAGYAYGDIQGYFNNVLTKQQALDATSIHMHVTKEFLERRGWPPTSTRQTFARMSKLPAMKQLKHLRISIGVSGWAHGVNPPRSPFAFMALMQAIYAHLVSFDPDLPRPPVDPLPLDLRVAGEVDIKKMRALMEHGDHVPIEENSFASDLLNLGSLETLTIEFDAITPARPSLEELVNHARTWVFPRKPKGRGKARVEEEMRVLSPTEVSEWKAFTEHQKSDWTVLNRGVEVDKATTMKLKWVVVPKVAESTAA